MVHEAIVAETHTQRHSVLSGRAVSLGNQINDAHSRSVTMPVYTFAYTADCSTTGLRYLCVMQMVIHELALVINMCIIKNYER